MSNPQVAQMLRQYSRPGKTPDSQDWLKILASLHPKQKEFVLNADVAVAGRGGGKSFGQAAKFWRPWASNAGRSSVFVTASAERARDILMPALDIVSSLAGIPIREYGKARAVIWPNGYRLLFRGCKDKNEANKRRGTGWVRGGWDEGDSIHPNLLQYDVEECVEPRLVDFAGEMFFAGTPGAIPEGYWYDISSGKNPAFRVVHWDARDNPHLHNVENYFLKALRRICGIHPSETVLEGITRTCCKGVTPPTVKEARDFFRPELQALLPARFQREYLGLWVKDVASLCYVLTPQNNYAGRVPIVPDRTTIGLDLGGASQENPHLDHCAWTVCQSSTSGPGLYIPESSKDADMTPTTLGVKALQLVEKYSVPGQPSPIVYIDSAGAGKLIETQFRRMGLAVRPAIKGPKKPRIQLVQHAIAQGDLKFSYQGTESIRVEATVLCWDERHRDHNPRLPDDACDSMLYAVIPHLQDYDPEEEEPVVGSKEHEAQQADADFDAAFEEACDEIDDMGI